MSERYEIDGLAYEDVDWDLWYAQEDADQQEWEDWWDAYVAEKAAERKQRGYDI